MIVEAIINAALSLLQSIVNLLPTTPGPPDLSAKVSTAFGAIAGYMAAAADWFPVNELGTALVGLLGFMAAIHVVRLVIWLAVFVRLGGGD